MITIGITGGIGSGKSYVCKLFSNNGVPVYDCDSRAKMLLISNKKLKFEIVARFGNDCYKDDKWNRDYIIELNFKDPTVMDEVAKMVGPYLLQDLNEFKLSSGSELVAVESAILTKSKSLMSVVDKVLVVAASLETRMERIKKRDPFRTEKEIKLLIEKQNLVCDTNYLINNDGNENVEVEVKKVIASLSECFSD